MLQYSTARRPASCLVVAIVVSSFANACATAPIRPAPAPASVPAPIATTVIAPTPAAASWSLPVSSPITRYVTEVNATLERDSAGRVLQQHVQSRGVISLLVKRDSLGGVHASGAVDSFTVRGLENVLAPAVQTDVRTGKTVPAVGASSGSVAPALPLSVAFDAVLDAHMLRVTTRPPLANECDRPEGGATNLVREVVVRLPRTMSAGMQWSDSTVGFMCRLNLPITVRTRSLYSVQRAEKMSDHVELVVQRISDTQLDGAVQSTWRTVTLGGAGHATQSIRVDVGSGAVRSIEGDGMLTIKLSDTGRRDGSGTQELRQKTTSRTIVRP